MAVECNTWTMNLRSPIEVTENTAGWTLHMGEFRLLLPRQGLDEIDLISLLQQGVASSHWLQLHSLDRVSSAINSLQDRGLVEYRLLGEQGNVMMIASPQLPSFRLIRRPLSDRTAYRLSRFALMRRSNRHFVLESPMSDALFAILDPRILHLAYGFIHATSHQHSMPGCSLAYSLQRQLLEVFIGHHILVSSDATERGNENHDNDLACWDFHDLLFHARSRSGRHSYVSGGISLAEEQAEAPPLSRSAWSGDPVDLPRTDLSAPASPVLAAIESRRSERSYDQERPINLYELSEFLFRSIRSRAPKIEAASLPKTVFQPDSRPYPSGGACYELEIYLNVARCDGLASGFYHYRPEAHQLARLSAPNAQTLAQIARARASMQTTSDPQILIGVTARFRRIAWKYRSIAYATMLKNLGALFQTWYLIAGELELAACALGDGNIDLFSSLLNVPFYEEPQVGEFALGRPSHDAVQE